MKSFFSRPEAEKMAVAASGSGLRGYIGFYQQGNYGYEQDETRTLPPEDDSIVGFAKMDAKEVFTLGPEPLGNEASSSPMLFAKNAWPVNDPEFQKNVWEYYCAVRGLSIQIFSILALALELPQDYFLPHITNPMNSMNMIHYPPKNDPRKVVLPGQLGIGGHTDFECFTLLSQNNTPGLEIWNGEEWLGLPPIENGFVVNIGDMMARWSNDLFQSTIHRASNHADRDRYSIAYFCACNYETPLSCLVKGAQPKYEPVIAGEHLLRRILQANNV